jgi:hypothetical protein
MVRRVAVATLALLLLATAAHAGDGKKYEVRAKPVWKAGDTFTTVGSSVEENSITLTVEGTTKKGGGVSTKLAFTCVERVDAVRADGKPTKRTIHFAKWSLGGEGEPDTTIEGAQIEVTGVGAERDWNFLGDAPVASKPSMDWLKAEYGPEHEGAPAGGPYAAFATKQPVAIGETWGADSRLFDAKKVGGELVEAEDHGKATAKLERVEKGVATVSVEGSLPFKNAGDEEMTWDEKAGISVRATASIPLDGRIVRAERSTEVKLDATATLERDGTKVAMRLEFRRRVEEKSTPGGTIPPPPKLASEK